MSQCLLCRGERFSVVHRLVDHPLVDHANARIVRCEACDLVQLEALPSAEELEKLYAHGYFDGIGADAGYDDYANQEREYRATFDEDVRRIEDFLTAGSVLDVGCGYGYFVRQALAAGFDAYGVDLSSEGVAEAEKHAPGRVFVGTIDDVPEVADRCFDVIFASHLIEHITEPRVFVANLLERLSPTGVMIFVTPNIESWLARLSGRRWVSFKVPEHVAYYTPGTITHLLEGAGLEILSVDSAYQYYRLPFLMSKIRQLIDPIDRILPQLEDRPGMRDRMFRVSSGSLRVIARRPLAVARGEN